LPWDAALNGSPTCRLAARGRGLVDFSQTRVQALCNFITSDWAYGTTVDLARPSYQRAGGGWVESARSSGAARWALFVLGANLVRPADPRR
jgi:hypothetical protein